MKKLLMDVLECCEHRDDHQEIIDMIQSRMNYPTYWVIVSFRIEGDEEDAIMQGQTQAINTLDALERYIYKNGIPKDCITAVDVAPIDAYSSIGKKK